MAAAGIELFNQFDLLPVVKILEVSGARQPLPLSTIGKSR